MGKEALKDSGQSLEPSGEAEAEKWERALKADISAVYWESGLAPAPYPSGRYAEEARERLRRLLEERHREPDGSTVRCFR